MEPDLVLRTLLAHCSGDQTAEAAASQPLATNAVLEWFGRTIRGRCRIEQFLRYDVRPQYEQRFGGGAAAMAEAFEVKPAHLQSRTLPPDDALTATSPPPPSAGGSDSDSDLELLSCTPTAAHQLRPPSLPVPGAPARGRTFVRTPPRSPPSSPSSPTSSSSPPSSGIEADSAPAAEAEITPPPATLRGVAAATEAATPTGHFRLRRPPAHRTSAEKHSASAATQYSALHYVEACGTVRQSHSVKHQRLAAATTASNSAADAPDDSSRPGSPQLATNGGRWERSVRLRLSYRLCSDGGGDGGGVAERGIQFALIVYEPLERNPRTRRNLLGAFGRTEASSPPAADAGMQGGDAAIVAAQASGQEEERTPLKAATAASQRTPATDAPKASERTAEAFRRYAASVAKSQEAAAGGVKRTAAKASFKTSLKRLRF